MTKCKNCGCKIQLRLWSGIKWIHSRISMTKKHIDGNGDEMECGCTNPEPEVVKNGE